MEKIFELTTEDWSGGLTQKTNRSDQPVLNTAIDNLEGTKGVSSVDFISNQDNYGMLGVGSRPWEMEDTDGDVFEDIDAAVLYEDISTASNQSTIVLYASNGNTYKGDYPSLDSFNIQRDNSPFNDTAAGAEIFQKKDGTQYFLYSQDFSIGRVEENSLSNNSSYSDSWASFSDRVNQRVMYSFQDRVYVGNGSKVSMIFEENSSMKINKEALDLPPTERIIDFTQQGKYLVIATDSGEVFFWDTNADSWQQRYTVKKSFRGLYSVFNIQGDVVVLMDSGIYSLRFSTPPTPVFEFANLTNLSPLHEGSTYVTKFGQSYASTINQRLYWVTYQNDVAMFDYSEGTIHIPFTGLPNPSTTKENSLIPTVSSERLLVSVFGEGMWAIDDGIYKNSSGGTEAARQAQTQSQAETRVIDMGETYQINMIEVLFNEPLGTNIYYTDDEIDFRIRKSTDDAYEVWGNVTSDSDERKVEIRNPSNSVETDTLQIKMDFEGGNPQVRSVAVYGDQID